MNRSQKNVSRTTKWRRRQIPDGNNSESDDDQQWRDFNRLHDSSDSSINISNSDTDSLSHNSTSGSTASSESYVNNNHIAAMYSDSNISVPSDQDLRIPANGSDSYDSSVDDNYTTEDSEDAQFRAFENNNESDDDDDDDDDDDFGKLKNIIEENQMLDIRVNISIASLLLMVLKYSQKFDLCQTAMAKLFKMLNVIFRLKVLPESRYLVDKIFNSRKRQELHSVCPSCESYVGKFDHNDRQIVCPICNVNIQLKDPTYRDYFVIFNVENNISNLLKQNIDYYDNIVGERVRNRGTYNDFTDGRLYKRWLNSLPEIDKNTSITTTFNTDGAPVFESSKVSIWPIQMVINELPLKTRLAKPIICGLWFGKDKPQMNMFLKPFVNVMNKLSNEGIRFRVNNDDRHIKVYAACSCVDSVARAPMQGFIQFNGYYGCCWCMHPGVYVPTLRGGSVKYVLLEDVPPKRTAAQTLYYMQESITANHPVFGVKNPSWLINLEKFDIISGFVPDSMHNVSLGVVDQFTSYWVDSSNMVYSLTNDEISIIDNVIQDIKVPNQITRLSRGINERKWWKAREWENWILYYSIPALSCIPRMEIFLRHWMLLVEAFYLLNLNNITRIQVNQAHEFLKEFVLRTQILYSQTAMTFNVHQLTHLAQSVIDWGPLWAHSGYCFENGNGNLLKKIHAAKGVVYQLCRIISMSQAELILYDYLNTIPYSTVHSYISDLENDHSVFSQILNNARYFGPNKPTKQRFINLLQLSDASRTYSKMVKNNCLYISSRRKQLRSSNAYAITDDNIYIEIRDFIVDVETNNEYVIYKIVNVEAINDQLSMKRIVNIPRDIEIITVDKIEKICVFIKTQHHQYICSVPNLHHY